MSNDVTFKIGANTKEAKKALGGLNKQIEAGHRLAKQKELALQKNFKLVQKGQALAARAHDQELKRISQAERASIAAERRKQKAAAQLSRAKDRAHKKELDQIQERDRKTHSALAALGAAAVVGLGASIVIAAKLEYELSRVRLITGATGLEFHNLSEQVSLLGRTTIFSSQEAAEGLKFLSMAGMSASESMVALPSVLAIAEVGMMDLGTAADITTNIMAGYGLKAAELAGVGDELVATFSNSNTTLQELGESFKNAGPVAKTAGLEFQDVAAAIGMLGNAGFKGERAGVGLRNMIANLVKPTKDTKRALHKLNISAKDLTEEGIGGLLKILRSTTAELDPSAKLSLLIGAFGRRAGPQMAALLNQSQEKFDELRKSIDDSGGSMEDFQRVMRDTTEGRMKTATSAVKGFAEEIGKSLKPAVDGTLVVVAKLAGAMTDLNKAWREWQGNYTDPQAALAGRMQETVDQKERTLAKIMVVRRELAELELTSDTTSPVWLKRVVVATKILAQLKRDISGLDQQIARLGGKSKKIQSGTSDRKGNLDELPDGRKTDKSLIDLTEGVFDQAKKERQRRAGAEIRRKAAAAKAEEQRIKKALKDGMKLRDAAKAERDERYKLAQQASFDNEEFLQQKIEAEYAAAQLVQDRWGAAYDVIGSAALGSMQMAIDGWITGQENWMELAIANFMSVSGSAIVGHGVETIMGGIGMNALAPGSGVAAMAVGAGMIAVGVGMGAGATAIQHVAAGGTIGQALPGSGVSSGGFEQGAQREDPRSRQLVINVQYGVNGPHPEDTAEAVMDAYRLGSARGL